MKLIFQIYKALIQLNCKKKQPNSTNGAEYLNKSFKRQTDS